MAPENRHELTVLERTTLANQHRILMLLDEFNADYHKQLVHVLEYGIEREYYRLFEPMMGPITHEECEFVVEVLDMYRALGASYHELEERGDLSESDITFDGWDGNNETRLLSYHEFLFSDGKWTESEPKNCHYPSVDVYHRMLAEFNPIEEQIRNEGGILSHRRLNLAELKQVVNARIHPENR